MSGGYTGKYGIVDLTKGTTELVRPEEAFYRKYLSGYGLGVAVITERQKPGVDPLSPESYLGFCSGLLTGTGAFFSGRWMAVGKSPLTGGWGDANAGGYFSRELKRTGFDALFFTGSAKGPVWAFVENGSVQIRDGTSLWGRDTVETENLIKEELGDKRVQVVSIGISGEKRSLISGIVTDGGRIAARSGLGAVMGSKNLKAVALRGRQKISVAEPDRMKAVNKRFLKEYKKSKILDRITVSIMNFLGQVIGRTGLQVPAQTTLVREVYKKYGTSGLTVYSAMTGDMPIKNWEGVGYLDYPADRAAKTSDENVIRHQRRRYACQSCPLGCGGILDIHKGRYAETTGHKPEYETLAAFGGLLLHDDLDVIIEINEMCNRAGIDTISTGGAIAFAIECFEKGVIDEETTGGLALGWGKSREILKLTEMIILREGLGDLLADGVKRASEEIGKASEPFAVHAGGQELPMHDPRLDSGYAISYLCEPTPGRHTISCYLYSNLFGVEKRFPAARKRKNGGGKEARAVRKYVAGSLFVQLLNGSGLCLFGALTSSLPVVDYLNAATGWGYSPDEYLKIGERILNLRKAFNVREGIRPIDQKVNERALGTPPMHKGPLRGVTVDAGALEKVFLETMGWDAETGGPTRKKMSEFGIDSLFPLD
jgi:aldehyde:ferredoxin oxidoreductase